MASVSSLEERLQTYLRNRLDYHRDQYRELQIRREFIDPFFEALGWDVTNRAAYSEAYKDVVAELPTRIGGNVKAPDYAFRIGGSPKFLVEAKRPSVNVRGSGASSFQLRRYAFSMGLSIGIVTDFEEFAVYDTTIRPAESDPPTKARIRYLTCEDYLEQWDWIEVYSQKTQSSEGISTDSLSASPATEEPRASTRNSSPISNSGESCWPET